MCLIGISEEENIGRNLLLLQNAISAFIYTFHNSDKYPTYLTDKGGDAG
jgi:hypothetical protein